MKRLVSTLTLLALTAFVVLAGCGPSPDEIPAPPNPGTEAPVGGTTTPATGGVDPVGGGDFTIQRNNDPEALKDSSNVGLEEVAPGQAGTRD